jgi:Sec-independent protein translocase protein TatA
MFDISWGEIFVVGAVGVALTGRRDMPAACRFVGSQVGRVVGLLQGARARADQFAHHNELKQLQNEFRSGLRELDQVKMELAVAASSQGMMGRTLGSTTASANRAGSMLPPASTAAGRNATASLTSGLITTPQSSIPSAFNTSMPSSTAMNDLFDFQVVDNHNHNNNSDNGNASIITPRTMDVTSMERAVMEEEWEKQGIGFRSIAERGQWNPTTAAAVTSSKSNSAAGTAAGAWDTSKATGSELLEYLERQCLIFDQYDRAMAKEDQVLQDRILQKQEEREQHRQNTGPPPSSSENKDVN